jgi:3-deoxy-manno-octulosonate cytidylyltransferase (CMP-KDO synthetase)|tara:strand:- start:237 stop:974 length:738 start_codon:yes stop_codon:yes gene_type:complete
MSKTIILIPSRLDASRLPNKPLLKINNKSLINHVYEKGLSTNIGEVYVATGDKEVFEEVKQNKGKSILTSKEHNTGTDRIFEALEQLNIKDIKYVINLQGDEPLLDIKDIINLKNFAVKKNSKIATLACKLESKNFENESVVKVRCKNNLEKNKISCAQEFLRFADKKNSKNIYHHIGIYIYEVSILKKFVSMNQSSNEINLRLEQLRALDNNIRIDVVFAKSSSIGVDTQEDYMEIKKLMEYKS